MLIDEATITITSGTGGEGRVSFYLNRGKPSGGDGGRGGAVYAVVSSQLTTLSKYVRTPRYKAADGGPGDTFNKTGKNAEDLTLSFPTGTQLIDLDSNEPIELQEQASPVLLCKGGRGGWGNTHFSRKNLGMFSKALPGMPGITRRFKVVMRLIADCGFIGLPNAGKSSLLNVLTDAHAKVANYPFTTLEPNLGILKTSTYGKRIVLADIPGLIEGASTGKGLGDKFLKHIEKVNVLLHCISCESTDMHADYQKIRDELRAYNPLLLDKKEIIILTKVDTLCDDASRQKLEKIGRSLASTVVFVSILDDTTISQLTDLISSSA